MASSNKWKGFENSVAKAVSAWLFGDPKVLRRSPCSGGWKGRGSDGDIILAAEEDQYKQDFMFSIEAKCRGGGKKTWHFEQLLTSPKHPILDWWYQLTNSKPVKEDNKLRMLVFSKTSGLAKAFVGIGHREMDFLEEAGTNTRAMPKILFEVGRCEDPSVKTEVLHIFRLLDFLEYVDADNLKKVWRNHNGFSSNSD